MARDDALRVSAKVVEALPNAVFRVELENGHQIMAHVVGQDAHALHPHPARRHGHGGGIPYDLTKGRIVYRE